MRRFLPAEPSGQRPRPAVQPYPELHPAVRSFRLALPLAPHQRQSSPVPAGFSHRPPAGGKRWYPPPPERQRESFARPGNRQQPLWRRRFCKLCHQAAPWSRHDNPVSPELPPLPQSGHAQKYTCPLPPHTYSPFHSHLQRHRYNRRAQKWFGPQRHRRCLLAIPPLPAHRVRSAFPAQAWCTAPVPTPGAFSSLPSW